MDWFMSDLTNVKKCIRGLILTRSIPKELQSPKPPTHTKCNKLVRCTRRCPGKAKFSIVGLFLFKGTDDHEREVRSFRNHFQSISHVRIGSYILQNESKMKTSKQAAKLYIHHKKGLIFWAPNFTIQGRRGQNWKYLQF